MCTEETQRNLIHTGPAERDRWQLLDAIEIGLKFPGHTLHGVAGCDDERVPPDELRRVVAQGELLGVAAEHDDRNGVVERLVDSSGVCPVRGDQEYSGLQQAAGVQRRRQLPPLERVEGRIAIDEESWREDAPVTAHRVPNEDRAEQEDEGDPGDSEATPLTGRARSHR